MPIWGAWSGYSAQDEREYEERQKECEIVFRVISKAVAVVTYPKHLTEQGKGISFTFLGFGGVWQKDYSYSEESEIASLPKKIELRTQRNGQYLAFREDTGAFVAYAKEHLIFDKVGQVVAFTYSRRVHPLTYEMMDVIYQF